MWIVLIRRQNLFIHIQREIENLGEKTTKLREM